jgi:hypothetical protein
MLCVVHAAATSQHRQATLPTICRPVKTKLTAYRGRLVEVTEQLGERPNGTAFAITLRAMPSLDQTNLVVGKVAMSLLSRCPARRTSADCCVLLTMDARASTCSVRVQVVEGMDVVQALAGLPAVKDNSGSGYVKCGLSWHSCSNHVTHTETSRLWRNSRSLALIPQSMLS